MHETAESVAARFGARSVGVVDDHAQRTRARSFQDPKYAVERRVLRASSPSLRCRFRSEPRLARVDESEAVARPGRHPGARRRRSELAQRAPRAPIFSVFLKCSFATAPSDSTPWVRRKSRPARSTGAPAPLCSETPNSSEELTHRDQELLSRHDAGRRDRDVGFGARRLFERDPSVTERSLDERLARELVDDHTHAFRARLLDQRANRAGVQIGEQRVQRLELGVVPVVLGRVEALHRVRQSRAQPGPEQHRTVVGQALAVGHAGLAQLVDVGGLDVGGHDHERTEVVALARFVRSDGRRVEPRDRGGLRRARRRGGVGVRVAGHERLRVGALHDELAGLVERRDDAAAAGAENRVGHGADFERLAGETIAQSGVCAGG